MSNRNLQFLTIATATLLGFAAGCATNDDTGAAESEVSAAQCAAAAAWVEWHAYATGDVVTYAGDAYQCLQGHTSEPGWEPANVAALWTPVACAGGSAPPPTTTPPPATGGGTCDPAAWVYMASDANACTGHLGEACGWTSDNESQGYHCATTSWGTGCEPGGATCPGGTGTGTGSGSNPPPPPPPPTGTGTAPAGLVFSAYKDTSINMNWNTNVITTKVTGAAANLADDLAGQGGKAITLAFATGECGSENWGGVGGAAMASANVGLLAGKGIDYILSTGGAAGSFTCGSDAGFAAFLSRWSSAHLIGVDFDIEAGQSAPVIQDLVRRIAAAHAAHPGLRFSLTLATLANTDGATSLNSYGTTTIAAVRAQFGSAWPSYVTVNLMTMDYGSPGPGLCVVSGGLCDMGASAVQAAKNLNAQFGIPYGNIELTPMIGGNDTQNEHFTIGDTDTMTAFAIQQKLAGVHYWSYDRDTDCPAGYASPTCNSLGGVGTHGFLKRFLADGLH